MNLGEKIKEKREDLGISQRELARRIAMSGQMISKIESGLSTPSIDTINKIASIFNVPMVYLLDDINEESFSYKLIRAIEKSYNDKCDISPTQDILQVLSSDLDINYEDFEYFLHKKTICTKDSNNQLVYNQIPNNALDKTKELPIDDIKKLLAFYRNLDNYKFQKFCFEIFNNNLTIDPEIKKIINEMVPETQSEEHKKLNINQYYKYLETRIVELACNSNINISKSATKKIINNIDSLIEFELYKLKNNNLD